MSGATKTSARRESFATDKGARPDAATNLSKPGA